MMHTCIQSACVNFCVGAGKVAKKRWSYECIVHICAYSMYVSSCEGGGRAAGRGLVVRWVCPGLGWSVSIRNFFSSLSAAQRDGH